MFDAKFFHVYSHQKVVKSEIAKYIYRWKFLGKGSGLCTWQT